MGKRSQPLRKAEAKGITAVLVKGAPTNLETMKISAQRAEDAITGGEGAQRARKRKDVGHQRKTSHLGKDQIDVRCDEPHLSLYSPAIVFRQTSAVEMEKRFRGKRKKISEVGDQTDLFGNGFTTKLWNHRTQE